MDHQRLILVGTGQSLAFDSIYDAMILQHPEFRAPPPVVGRDGQAIKGHPKGQGRGAPPYSPGTNAPGQHNQHQKSSGKGYAPRQAFATVALDQPEVEPLEQEEEDDASALGAIDEEQPDEDFDDHQDETAASVLTVTAKRLSGMTLGRKFTGGKPSGKKSPAELKKTTHCIVCGRQGHWQGDPECEGAASTGASSGKSLPKGGRPEPKGRGRGKQGAKGAHAVHTVTFTEPDSVQISDNVDYGTLFSVNAVFSVSDERPHHLDSLRNYMVLDTACQRSCAGMDWYQGYKQTLKDYKLNPLELPIKDNFMFGDGKPRQAVCRAYLPIGLAHQHDLLLGTGILEANIPLLASHDALRSRHRLGQQGSVLWSPAGSGPNHLSRRPPCC